MIATIHQAKTHLSKLIRKALDGEEVIIANRDKPLVRLESVAKTGQKRSLGWAKGIATYMADDFNDDLPEFEPYVPPRKKLLARRKSRKKR